MKGKGSNIEKMGSMLQSQMTKTMKGNEGIQLELGTINGSLALVVPSLSNPIPRGEYMVCRQLTLGKTGAVLTQTKSGQGSHSHPDTSGGAHIHDVIIPEKMRWLKSGDHVLVAWVGMEPVVVDLVYNSKPYGG